MSRPRGLRSRLGVGGAVSQVFAAISLGRAGRSGSQSSSCTGVPGRAFLLPPAGPRTQPAVYLDLCLIFLLLRFSLKSKRRDCATCTHTADLTFPFPLKSHTKQHTPRRNQPPPRSFTSPLLKPSRFPSRAVPVSPGSRPSSLPRAGQVPAYLRIRFFLHYRPTTGNGKKGSS